MEYGAHRSIGLVHWEQKHNYSKGLEFGEKFLFTRTNTIRTFGMQGMPQPRLRPHLGLL